MSGSALRGDLRRCGVRLGQIAQLRSGGSAVNQTECCAPPHAGPLLAEWLIPEDGQPNWTLFVDLIMMAELTGKERTESEFPELLARAGFRPERVIDARFSTFILESSMI